METTTKAATVIPGQPICKRPRPPVLSAAILGPAASKPEQAMTAIAAEPKNHPARSTPAGSSAEWGYLKKHRAAGTMMILTLKSGRVIRGRIGWMDTYSMKLEREPAEPNVLVFKSAIESITRGDRGGNSSEDRSTVEH